mmetsp:Transcript_99679/g.157779  ORF Transcript_99679/g.157779 Transcript_99679/m.157779 type:complete len:186 (+) Transcript_99679:134-691(+)
MRIPSPVTGYFLALAWFCARIDRTSSISILSRNLGQPVVVLNRQRGNGKHTALLRTCLRGTLTPASLRADRGSCVMEAWKAYDEFNIHRSSGLDHVSPTEFCRDLCDEEPVDPLKCHRKCMQWVNPMDFCTSICPDDSTCVTECETDMYQCKELPTIPTDAAMKECVQKVADKYEPALHVGGSPK